MTSLTALGLLTLGPAALAQDVPAPAAAEVPAAATEAAPIEAAVAAAPVEVAAPTAADSAPAAAAPTLTTAPLQLAPTQAVASRPAQELSPTDAELQRRFLEAPAASATPSLIGQSGSSWWVWPLGLLGLVGAAGLAVRQRQSGGIPSEVTVLSRTPISRTASLAVIEVAGADGVMRRLLIGVGGGAPSMVADLSAGAVASVATTPVEAAWMRSAPAATATATVAAPAAAVAVEDEEVAEAPRRVRGAAAYAAEAARAAGEVPKLRRKRREEREDLLAEVLAEREGDRSDTTDSNWKDPWARNFEALLGQSGSTGR